MRKLWNKAEPLFLRAVDLLERSVGPDHSSTGDALANLGQQYAMQGKYGQAETALRRALNIHQKAFGPDNISVATVSWRLAGVLMEERKYAEAKTLFVASLSFQERVLRGRSPEFATALEQYAVLLRKMENSSQAAAVEAHAKSVRFELMSTIPADQLRR